jgi:hypothetical protein
MEEVGLLPTGFSVCFFSLYYSMLISFILESTFFAFIIARQHQPCRSIRINIWMPVTIFRTCAL